MKVPLTTRDHIERVALVYGDRIGVVDEPTQVAPPLGDLTYREVLETATVFAAGVEALGVPVGGRVAIVSQNAGRLLTLLYGTTGWGRVAVPINFRLHPHEVQYIVDHSGAEVLLVDPELEESLSEVTAPQKYIIGSDTDELIHRFDIRADPVGRGRGRHRDDQLHERHHGPAEGRRDDAPQPVGERGDVRVAGGGHRPRRLPAHPADVPLQRLGHARSPPPRSECPRSCSARSTAPRSCVASTSTASR